MSPAILLGLAGIILLLFGGIGFPFLMAAFIFASLGVALSYHLVKRAQELDDA